MVAPVPNAPTVVVGTVPLRALLAVQAVPQVQSLAFLVVLEAKEEVVVLEMMIVTHCIHV